MIPPGSRYEQAERQFTQSHIYNQYGYPYLEGTAPNLKIKVVNQEATYLMLPLVGRSSGSPQVDYFVKDDESVQFLAYKFLGDANRWWEIADSNPNVWYPLDLTMGDYIGIDVQT